MYDGWQLIGFPLAVKDSSHWLFAGTGLTDGTLLQNLVGFEFDRQFDASVSPPGLSTPLESPVVTAEGLPNRSHTVVRTTASGRLVFSAGTIWWPLGISHDPALSFYDARVARMTLNVLERALSHRRAPRQLASAIGGETPPVNPPQAKWAQSVTALAGRAGVAGDDDGPAGSATFNGPTGLAVTATGDVVVADTGNNKIRLIHRDTNTVETIAGTGALGLNTGSVPGASAMFRSPTGVAVGPDGAIYVADSDNHLIRRIEGRPPYTVTVFAGATRSQGFVDGILSAARFRRPTAVAFGADGTLYVADQANNRIRAIKNGLVSTLAIDGINYLNNPSAVAVGPDGDVYAIDSANARILRFDPERADGDEDRRRRDRRDLRPDPDLRLPRRHREPGPGAGADGPHRLLDRRRRLRRHRELPGPQGRARSRRGDQPGVDRGRLGKARDPPRQRRDRRPHRPRRDRPRE